jgi:hypothetical protein
MIDNQHGTVIIALNQHGTVTIALNQIGMLLSGGSAVHTSHAPATDS